MKIYRKAGATKKHRRSSSGFSLPSLPSWGSFTLGVIVGIVLTSLIYFKFATSEVTLKLPTEQTMNQTETASPTLAMTERQVVQAQQPQQPQFDFYNELTKSSQPSRVSQTSPLSQAPASQPNNQTKVLDLKSPPKTINGYLVQAGSFKKRADADALKAELALNGINTSIETAKLSDGNVWYRVLTGPFTNEKTAKSQQQAMKSFASDSIILHRYAE